MFSLAGKRVWVAGHRGMVGASLVRRLTREQCDVLTVDRAEVDLMEQQAVRNWLRRERPDAVFVAAARVGGILANARQPADYLLDNLLIAANVIEASYRSGVAKLLFLGSSCVYPKFAPQPVPETALLTGPLEPTNEWYAIAKIAGIKLCQAFRQQHGVDFISAMPTNLYGPGDNFDQTSSHVLPALIRKAHDAKLRGSAAMTIWGTGTPRREFLHVDDCADACVHLMQFYSDDRHVNVGTGEDISIIALARLICDIIGCNAAIEHDEKKPDGTPRKLLDISLLRGLGWAPRIDLRDGIADTYRAFMAGAGTER